MGAGGREREGDDFLIIFLNDTSALHPGCVIVITVPLFLGRQCCEPMPVNS